MFDNIITPPDISQVELYVKGICSRADYKKFTSIEVKDFKDLELYDFSWNNPKKMYLILMGKLPICALFAVLGNVIAISQDGTAISFPNRIGGRDILLLPWKIEKGEEKIKQYITSVFSKTEGGI